MVQPLQSTAGSAEALLSAGAPEALTSQYTAPQTQAPAKVQDTVTLSAAAQAAQLLHQGRSVAQIAAALGTSATLIDSELGIAPPKGTAVAAAVQGLPATAAKTS